jgi:GTP-binding protein
VQESVTPMDLRNVAIIAHVDHGKTTLVDNLLKQAGAFRTNQVVAERAMDRNDLERERGITILAKCTAVEWQGTKINIVDTPGHADFGGEVERILSMVDGAIVLVDAAEGPLPQTKFVVGKALARGIRPIVVINKVDRQDARPDEVLNEVFDLFAALGADDDQLDFPILYAFRPPGLGRRQHGRPEEGPVGAVRPGAAPRPRAGQGRHQALRHDGQHPGSRQLPRPHPHRPRRAGPARVNMPLKILRADGSVRETGRLTKLLSFRGLERVPVETGRGRRHHRHRRPEAGTIPDTVCAPEVEAPLHAVPGRSADARHDLPHQRRPARRPRGQEGHVAPDPRPLFKETEGNVAIRVKERGADAFEVAGRGELQLGVLIEQMRREGFELTIGRPRV